MHLLSLLIFFPIAVSLLILALPPSKTSLIRGVSILAGIVELGVVINVYLKFNSQLVGYQLFEEYDWITLSLGSFGKLSIDYAIGIDGLSLPLVIMSAVVFLIAIIASYSIDEKIKGYYALLMLLFGTVMGCFLALDFFLFFLFFEFMLLPMYFLIGIWGGPRREYASIKFYLYTLFGSVLILIVMIGLYASAYEPNETSHSLAMNLLQYFFNSSQPLEKEFVHTLRLDHLSNLHNYISGSVLHINNKTLLLGFTFRQWAFLFLVAGFIIKLPSVPFHTWLPDAHVEAPTPVSVILAAILLKIGAYGLLRIAYPLFPHEAEYFGGFIGGIGLLSIIYGAYCALAQTDIKKLIAYSSISHMGFVLMGIASLTSEGVSGAVYQMVSHGIISSSLFLIAGFIYEQTHDRTIQHYHGLANKLPYFTAVTVITFFASLGLPGFSGFIAELLVFLGSFKSLFLPKWMALSATLGLILGAAYYLWTLQRMFFGQFWIKENLEIETLKDLSFIDYICFLPLILFMIVLGVIPSILITIFNPFVSEFIKLF